VLLTKLSVAGGEAPPRRVQKPRPGSDPATVRAATHGSRLLV